MQENRVLVIGDLHQPFTLRRYLNFCQTIGRKWNCNRVVFIGDMLDNHYASFHQTDPDGHGGANELALAKRNLKKYAEAFPDAIITLGNHDRLPARKAFNAGLTNHWIRTVQETIDVPGWEFVTEVIIDKVKYLHGEGRIAYRRAEQDKISIVQGHYHTNSYIKFQDGEFLNTFSMQIGVGFDRHSYAAAYAKGMQCQAINCGVVLENGRLPIIERMLEYEERYGKGLKRVETEESRYS